MQQLRDRIAVLHHLELQYQSSDASIDVEEQVDGEEHLMAAGGADDRRVGVSVDVQLAN